LRSHTGHRLPAGSHLPTDTRRQCRHPAAGRDTGNAHRLAVHAPGEDAPGFRCRHDFRALAGKRRDDPTGRRGDAADCAAQSAADPPPDDEHRAVHRASTVCRFVGGATRAENCSSAGVTSGRSGHGCFSLSHVGDAPGAA